MIACDDQMKRSSLNTEAIVFAKEVNISFVMIRKNHYQYMTGFSILHQLEIKSLAEAIDENHLQMNHRFLKLQYMIAS